MKPVCVLVVIVNYRTPQLALDAAGALEADVVARGDAHVVIVDNGSADGSAEAIAAGIAARGFGAWCTLVAEARNGGFAAGNNVAWRWYAEMAGGIPEHSWLLNPDTIAAPGAMGALVDFLASHPQVGIAGSRCLWTDGRVWTSAFRYPSARTELTAAFAFGPLTRLLGNRTSSLPISDVPAPADWVSGTSMMVRRAVVETIGTMDEGYFLYFEETDYCARAARAGCASWVVPASRVTHIGGQATGVTGGERTSRRRPRYWLASRARFLIGHYGVLATHAINLLWLLAYPVGKAIELLPGRHRDDPPRYWRDFLSAYYGAGGIMYRPAQRARRMGDGRADD